MASFFNIELALKMFGGKGQLYLIFNLVLISLVCLVGLPVIINGIKSLFSGGFCSDTGVMFALVLALVQNLLFVFSNNLVQENIKLLGCVAAFMLTCHMGARVIYIRQLIGEFEFCSQEMSFCNISEISNSADSTRIFKDVLSGEPDVKYSERVKSFSEFFETSSVSLPGDKTMKRLLPPTLLASLVIGMLVFIVSGDFLTGFTSLTAMVCVSVPAAVTIVDMLPFSVINDTLKPINAVIHSCAAAEEYAKTNAVVFDAEDIFENGGSLTGGVQFNQTSKVDSGILCAAALAKAVNSPLADEFMKMIVNGHGVLPPVRNVHVEDGLGIVGLVNGKLILLGNDELMKKYNVKQLPKKDVSKFNHDGCRPLYIAEQDTILTTFGEVYRANGRAKSCMLRMMNNNIMMYICSDDPGISEAFVEEVFLLAPNSVEIIRGESAKIYQEKYKNIIKENIRPGIIHTNRINSFLNSVDACLLLKEIFDVSRVIEQVGVGIGFALFAVLCLMVPIFAGASQIFVYQLLFTLLVYFLSKGYKSKKKGRR